ncbi:MAG TPA: Ig-like domain-containing protein [Bryobacteraceae bacterium]|nr:Ig-like domain-containing protein [Bryobacteraceae bacterium]
MVRRRRLAAAGGRQSLVNWGATRFLPAACLLAALAPACPAAAGSQAISLDGRDWRIAADADDSGWRGRWWRGPRPEAVPVRVPWAMQDALPGYHGVAWYWREFTATTHPHPGGRYLLRFGAVNYKADVWLNGTYLGGDEGGEMPFEFDVTAAVRAGAPQQLAVRVLDPLYDRRIDGMTKYETPRRGGPAIQHGGIEDSVELLLVPEARIFDVFAKPNCRTGDVGLELTFVNASERPVTARLTLSVTRDKSDTALAAKRADVYLKPGESMITDSLRIPNPLLWDLDAPNLYRVSVQLSPSGEDASEDIASVRFGFRDFRFDNGAFRLNGKRILLQAAPVSNFDALGFWLPYDLGASPDFFERRLMEAKRLGFNMVRVHRGAARRNMLDRADEIGLMIYEESFAASRTAPTPYLADRLRDAFSRLVRRDRNHASVVAWGLLNEIRADWPQFQEGVAALSLVRSLDPTRMVILNSGRWDNLPHIGSLSNPDSQEWEHVLGNERPDARTALATSASKEGENANAADMGDIHHYVGIPFSAESRALFRTFGHSSRNPILVSEFGTGSGIDLPALWESYEERGATHLEPAQFTRRMLDEFLADWKLYGLADTFGDSKTFFTQSLSRSARTRLELINALRANPKIAGFSNVSLSERPMLAQGIVTMYGETKPGMEEALHDALASARFSLFAEPLSCYTGDTVRLEAVLANAGALPAGEHTVLLEVRDAAGAVVYRKQVAVRIASGEAPLAQPVLGEDVKMTGGGGRYSFSAQLLGGPAIPGGNTELFVFDRAKLPAVTHEVVLWGTDAKLEDWLSRNEIRWRRFDGAGRAGRELILASENTPAPGGRAAFEALLERVAQGASVVFLSEKVFREGKEPARWLPLEHKGAILRPFNWLLTKDEWIKTHPVFEGLQRGGVVEYPYYRELLLAHQPILVKASAPDAAIAGAFSTSSFQNETGVYYSGLLVAEYALGGGRFLINTLAVRDNLGKSPQAERLLRNMLNHMGRSLDGPPARLTPELRQKIARTLDTPGGIAPAISIITPHSGAVVKAPGTVAITIRAAQLDRKLKKVEFFSNGIKIGEDTVRKQDMTSYALIWSGISRGTYELKARAVDDAGNQTNSQTVRIHVD